ncbi:hypothetical protein CFOL_v3_35933, partial [Cephalotus follicularis]
AFIS